MAGLLAWAADVVAGNGNSSSQQQQQQQQQEQPAFQFDPEQQEHVRRLDAKAASLQHSLRQLRQRIPPPDIAYSLPYLHADSLASQSALTMELNAHQATLRQAQMREASLLAENAAYVKAIATGQLHAKEKAQEARQLQARLQELESVDGKLRVELEQLQKLLADKDHMMHASESDPDGSKQLKGSSMSLEEKASLEAEELQRTRAELKLWEAKLTKVQKEWTVLQQTSARWPSPAQRENELDRRLRSLTEQLMAKQAQAELLACERDALELRLSQASEARQQLLSGNPGGSLKRNKIGRYGSSSAGNSSGSLLESKIHSHSGIADFGHMALAGVSSNLGRLGDLGNVFSQLKSRQSQTSMALRVIAVAYILGLHVIVFFILSFSS